MNYGELKAAIQSYLYDRTDLTQAIPTFIAMAERRIFRQLRVPSNERIVTYPEHDSRSIDLPTDFLEAKTLTWGGLPLDRVSDSRGLNDNYNRSASGQPRLFFRIGAQLHLHPVPDTANDISLVYWADLSGQLINDADTHDMLRIGADAYLHGSLVEASAYLGQDSRVPVWKGQFLEELAALQQQADEAEYAGSVVAVSNTYREDRRL